MNNYIKDSNKTLHKLRLALKDWTGNSYPNSQIEISDQTSIREALNLFSLRIRMSRYQFRVNELAELAKLNEADTFESHPEFEDMSILTLTIIVSSNFEPNTKFYYINEQIPDFIELSEFIDMSHQIKHEVRKTIIGTNAIYIDNNTFVNCFNLKHIAIPSNIISIGNFAFAGCYRLIDIELSHGLEMIGFGAFVNCGTLEHIEIPHTVKSIGDKAFAKCTGLQSVIIRSLDINFGSNVFDKDHQIMIYTNSPSIIEHIQENYPNIIIRN
jgi:hypothetical protein